MTSSTVEQRPFGRTGLLVSALGFGGAELGFDDGVTATAVAGLLHPAIDAGLTVIDTACAYLESERLIGEALSGRREKVHLFTKCGATDGFSRSDWSAAGIRSQLESSLRLLQTDRVELLQLHSCGVEVLERGEAIEALEALKREGKTRFIGYSGDGPAAVWAVKCGRFDALQTSLNVADQRVLDEALPLARETGLGVIAKRPVANVAWRHGAEGPTNSYHRPYWERLRTLDFAFTKQPLAEAVSVALRFTAFQPGVSTAIVGSSSSGRWNENAALLARGRLPEAEVQAIRQRWQERAAASWTGQQ
jgi:aryl-alcohol dehydrogenase-like predicted oxidoreductase